MRLSLGDIAQRIPGPKVFAQQCYPDPIVGPIIDDSHSELDSHKACLEEVMCHMQRVYNYHPTLFTNPANLKAIRKVCPEGEKFAQGHSAFQTGRTTYVYCSQCFNNSTCKDVWSCCVIAILSYSKETDITTGAVRSSVTVEALFPHAEQCTTELRWRRNYVMDMANGGRGYEKFPFPIEDIVGDTYSRITDSLDAMGLTDETGTKISNVTKQGIGEYDYDVRLYIKLDESTPEQNDMFSIGTPEFTALNQRVEDRIMLWFANIMNVPSEVCPLPMKDEFSKKEAFLFIGPQPMGNDYGTHLFSEATSIVYAGYEGKVRGVDDSDQIPHGDIGDVEVDGVLCSVTNNPKLKGHQKSGSIYIPLKDFRDLCFYNPSKTEMRVYKGEVVVFAGDKTHGGKTMSAAEPYFSHPVLHTHYSSIFHPRDLSHFQVDMAVVAMHFPHLLPRTMAREQVAAIKPISKQCIAAFKHALTNPGGNAMISRHLHHVIRDLTVLKIGAPETGAPETGALLETPQQNEPPETPNQKKFKSGEMSDFSSSEYSESEEADSKSVEIVSTPRKSEVQVISPPAPHKNKSSVKKTKHASQDAEAVLEGALNGCVTDVLADGSCGYHSAMGIIDSLGSGKNLDNELKSVRSFRQTLHEHGEANALRFAGEQPDGMDTIFKRYDGEIGFTIYGIRDVTRNPEQIRLRVFKHTVLNGIYRPRMSYKGFVGTAHWMNAGYVLPIFAHWLKPKSPIVLYSSIPSSSGNYHTFMTDVYTYNEEKDEVHFARYEDEISVVEGVTKAMVFLKNINHFKIVEIPDEVTEEGA